MDYRLSRKWEKMTDGCSKIRGKRRIFGEYPSPTPAFLAREFSVDRVLEWIIMRNSFVKCKSMGYHVGG